MIAPTNGPTPICRPQSWSLAGRRPGRGSRVIAYEIRITEVDVEGHQLPYIDAPPSTSFSYIMCIFLKALNGAYDLVASYLGFVTTPITSAVRRAVIRSVQVPSRVVPIGSSLMLIGQPRTHGPGQSRLFQTWTSDVASASRSIARNSSCRVFSPGPAYQRSAAGRPAVSPMRGQPIHPF